MKKILLATHFFFKLPDDFEGTLSDAFRLYAEFIDSESPRLTSGLKNQVTPSDREIPDHLWENFVGTVNEGGRVFCASSSIQVLSEDGTKWEEKPLGIRNDHKCENV